MEGCLRYSSDNEEMIRKVENISKKQLEQIKKSVGEAFVTNELFHNWGTVSERREDIQKYMDLYVDYVYEAGELYANEELTGFIGLEDSKKSPKIPLLKMLFKLMFSIEFSKIISLMHFVKQISNSNERFAKKRHLDALMVCVDKEHQGKGIATELVTFAKDKSDKLGIPLLFDTDMKEYAAMYKHFGCKLYNKVKADNGVTRYSLCYKKVKNDYLNI
jgi:GNAT superfamily N-acetyltransferase